MSFLVIDENIDVNDLNWNIDDQLYYKVNKKKWERHINNLSIKKDVLDELIELKKKVKEKYFNFMDHFCKLAIEKNIIKSTDYNYNNLFLNGLNKKLNYILGDIPEYDIFDKTSSIWDSFFLDLELSKKEIDEYKTLYEKYRNKFLEIYENLYNNFVEEKIIYTDNNRYIILHLFGNLLQNKLISMTD